MLQRLYFTFIERALLDLIKDFYCNNSHTLCSPHACLFDVCKQIMVQKWANKHPVYTSKYGPSSHTDWGAFIEGEARSFRGQFYSAADEQYEAFPQIKPGRTSIHC